MVDRSIASRPSLEQVMVIVDFMEKHQALALGHLRGCDGRNESKNLWMQLTKLANTSNGPTRSMKSWIKYWADKKSSVRAKVQSSGGDPNILASNLEKKIYDLFIANEPPRPRIKKSAVKQESQFLQVNFLNENSIDDHAMDSEPVLAFADTNSNVDSVGPEEKHMAIMEKLLKVMSEQATALSSLADASAAHAQATERLAEASTIQARAVDRIATSFESIAASSHNVTSSLVEIDTNLKRFYNTPPT